MPLRTKRAYERADPGDGARYLIDHLWPRGVTKDPLPLTEWRKYLAPTGALRRWYGHDPARFEELRKRYRRELIGRLALLEALHREARTSRVTLVYGARGSCWRERGRALRIAF